MSTAITLPDFTSSGFEVLRLIASGGMGDVYLAKDLSLERHVALKVPKGADVSGLKKLKAEAIRVASLRHGNINKVFSTFEQADLFVMVLEYIDGPDLRNFVLQNGKLSPQQALTVTITVASAMEAAHAQGLLHRDVKPANIMLDSRGNVFLMDFGLAMNLQAEKSNSMPGSISGTVSFMAPEQARGPEKTVPQSDIFSLMATLLFLISGKSPYENDTVFNVHTRGIPDELDVMLEGVPEIIRDDLSAIFVRSLDNFPANRPQSMRELIDALKPLRKKLGEKEETSEALVITSAQSLGDGFEPTVSMANGGSTAESRRSAPRGGIRLPYLALSLTLAILLCSLFVWWKWKSPDNSVQPITRKPEIVSFPPVAQEALPVEGTLTFSESKETAFSQLKAELRKQIPNFKDDDLILVPESQTIRLKLVDYKEGEVESFLLSLSESKGTAPSITDIMLAPNFKRPEAFENWASSHGVFVY